MAAKDKGADLWEGGIVAYTIDGDVARLDLINEAIAFLEANTNVRFVRRHDHSDYVRFRLDARSPFTSDSLGRDGGEQTISISSRNVGSYYHEIGHALGLIHEQQRSDRGGHIIIHFDRIPEDRHSDYEKRTSVNSPNYDYRSIMHYRAIQNEVVVMEAPGGIPDPADIGRLQSPTPEDIAFINQLYPAPGVIRRSSSEQGAGGISEISGVAIDSPNNIHIVTAVRDLSKRLRLISWDVDNLGGIRRDNAPDLNHGKATSIELTLVGDNLVACMRNDGGDLFLISWTLQLEKRADSKDLAGETDLVRILTLGEDSFLTACRDGNGRLKLITWRITAQGKFERIADTGTDGPKVKSISLALATGTNQRSIIAAAVRTESGRVQVFTYLIRLTDLSIVSLVNSGTKIGKGSHVACAVPFPGLLVVGCATDGASNLKLIPMTISRDGFRIDRLPGEAQAGKIRGLRMISRPYGVLTAVCNGSNNLMLIKWDVARPGTITRRGDSGDSAGQLVSSNAQTPLIDLVTLSLPRSAICTPVRNASGDLLLITWDDLDGPGELIR